MTATFLPWIVVLMIAVAGVQIGRRLRLWRRGQPAPVDWLGGLRALPKRYLVDVHHVVERDRAAAKMHVPLAGGLVAACGFLLIGLVTGLTAWRFFWALVTLAFLAMTAGALLEIRRRYPRRLARLSGGSWQTFPFALIAFAIASGLSALFATFGNALPALELLTLILAAVGGVALAATAAEGPMRHALAGATHLVVHPRPQRFGGGRSTELKPLDLDAEKLGTETPADFAWNRLVAFDACVQCGRCEAACPAFAAGQPLSPKHLIADLAAASAGGERPPYHGNPYPNARPVGGRIGLHAPIVSAEGVIHPDTLWSCTTCRACVEECPMMIEHVDTIIDLRRFQTQERGAIPLKAEEPLANFRGCDEPNGRVLAERTDFAAGLKLPVIAAGGQTDVLLWLGQAAFDLRGQRTLTALIRILTAAKVDIAVLGADERDCGDLARRLGDEATFQRLASANVAALASVRFRRILTADPHALHVLRNEYPAFGGTYEVVHHTAFLAELAAAGRIPLSPLAGRSITYHDPCYLGRYNGEVEAPRRLLDALGLERHEMARSGKRAMCCGGGGGAPVADIPGDTRIPDLRMAQAAETGAKTVAVACPQCAAMLEGVTGERPVVKDVAELFLEAIEAAAMRPAEAVRALEVEPA
ncbi:(Fe-S)-binding protein [Jiella sp. MQZ9-1]|uniref:DUF3483 domain-containing protein n=1 Tax=Jiella flava TaxID=2816857 RepID=A0A939G0Q3_9HYPH|nr:DUF3483 domain-containing protein [Jiella flava]MBO0664231.1 DUF3483 domain-containing protein [Jiella flava]MCD2472877.1 (Fe-S)-binding protein [Jiella flava]